MFRECKDGCKVVTLSVWPELPAELRDMDGAQDLVIANFDCNGNNDICVGNDFSLRFSWLQIIKITFGFEY